MSTSCGAWVALVGALLLAGLWEVSVWLSRDSATRQSWIFPILLLLALLVTLGIAVAWPGGIGAILETLPGTDVGIGRVELLRNTLTLVRDYPFIGAGLGSFQMLHSTYVMMIHVGFSIHSHNLFLNVSVELGLLVLLAVLWMWLLFAAAAWRGLMGWALELQPHKITANRRLGMIELSQGDHEDALGHLEAARDAESWNEINRRLLGEALIVNGQPQEGAALWATVSNEQRQLEARAYWYQYIGDAERAA